MALLCAPFIWAQGGGPEKGETPQSVRIGIDEAVSLALKNNLSLQSGQAALDKKKRPAVLAWNQFLPAVGASGGLSAANTVSSSMVPVVTPGSGVSFQTVEGARWSMSAGLQVQWQGLNFAMFEGVRQLKRAYEAGILTYQKAKVQLERDIRKLYSSILLAEENLKVQERSLELAGEQVRTAGENYQAGLSPELTLMQARLTRDNLIPTIDQSRNNIKVSMANLAMLLGLPYDTAFTLEPSGDVDLDLAFDTAELINSAAGKKIDILELRSNILAARTARNAIRYQLWTPSINLGWSTNQMLAMQEGSSWRDTGSFNMQLSWSLNGLLPFTTQAAALRDMNDDIRGMDINLAQLIRATEVEVYNTVFLIQQARESAEAQRKTVELAEQTYRDTLAAFRAGLRDFLEVQNVEQQLRQAQLGVLQQEYNFLSGVIDLEYAVGVPFGSLMK
jgi:outer membrane protein TolC